MDSVLLVTVDSLRADHVGHLGYERDTTPTIDELAADGTTFTRAFSHACSTRASFPSILSSVYAMMYGGYERLAPEQDPIAAVFDDAGYQTAGFHSNLYLSADFGYDRGFDHFFDSKTDPSALAKLRQGVKSRLDDDGILYRTLARSFEVAERQAGANIGSPYVVADEITEKAIDWIEGTDPGDPALCWVHYMDVHHPYVPPDEHQRAFLEEPIGERRAIKLRRKMIEEPDGVTDAELADLLALYDAEIRFADDQIGRLVEAARAHWGDTAVAVTADHGEEFGDHGTFSHPNTFYDEVMHVPLVFDGLGAAGEVDDVVGLLDLAPTLADSADLPVPETYCGQSLTPLLTDGDVDRDYVVGNWGDTETGERRYAYRDAEWKYIRHAKGEELYDLRDDPGETVDLSREESAIVDRLGAVVDDVAEDISATRTDLGEVEMEESVKERLRDLGYKE